MNYLHTDSLRTIRLYGKLGAKYGREFKFQVASCGEAIKALCAMLPGFKAELLRSTKAGVGYVCYSGKRNLTEDTLNSKVPEGDTIRIAPVVTGSKRGGLGQILLGAVLVVGAFWAAPALGAGAAGASAAGGAAGAGLFGLTGGYAIAAQLGVSMMLGGIVQALSPQQKALSTKDGPNNGASYNFTGVANTTAQGNVIPVGYGRMRVGSAVLNAAIYTEDQA